MTEAMNRMYLLQCVLIQALLIIDCCSACEEGDFTCPNITQTIGQSFNLTCKVTCDKCMMAIYKWKKNDAELDRGFINGSTTAYYTIQKPSMKDTGTFTFWLQLNSGCYEKPISVILTEEVIPKKAVSEYGSHGHKVVGILVTILTVLGLICLALLCRKKYKNKGFSETVQTDGEP